MNRLPLIVLMLFLFIPAVHGASGTDGVKGPAAETSAEPDLDSEKLLGSVFEGIREDPQTRDMVTTAEKALRRPGTRERTVLPAGTRLDSVEAFFARGDERRYVVLFCNAQTDATDVPGGGAAILAVFPEGGSEALDVVEVKSDLFCAVDSTPLLSLGPGDAFTITNSHHNAGQGYLTTTLFHIHGGRLQRVAEVFTLKVLGPCKESFDEKLSWKTEKDPGIPYLKVVATVTLTMGVGEDEGGDCSKKTAGFRKSVFSQTHRWNKAKGFYVSEGKGLDALDRFNRKRL